MTKVLLYSGGMDSWLISKLWNPDIKLFIDTGAEGNKEEIKRLPPEVIIKKIEIGEFEDKNKGYILPLRNLFFVEMASYYGDEICIGATQHSTHYDKNDIFASKSADLINYLYSESYDTKIKIVLPYRNKTKAEILKEYIDKGGNIEEAWISTFSCYSPVNGEMCGKCRSCMEKISAFKSNGLIYQGEDKYVLC